MYPFVKLTISNPPSSGETAQPIYVNVNDVVMFNPLAGGGTQIYLRSTSMGREIHLNGIQVVEPPAQVDGWFRSCFPR
jgi:hypothetical protein